MSAKKKKWQSALIARSDARKKISELNSIQATSEALLNELGPQLEIKNKELTDIRLQQMIGRATQEQVDTLEADVNALRERLATAEEMIPAAREHRADLVFLEQTDLTTTLRDALHEYVKELAAPLKAQIAGDEKFRKQLIYAFAIHRQECDMRFGSPHGARYDWAVFLKRVFDEPTADELATADAKAEKEFLD
jgi:chromosome segregation ATPase